MLGVYEPANERIPSSVCLIPEVGDAVEEVGDPVRLQALLPRGGDVLQAVDGAVVAHQATEAALEAALVLQDEPEGGKWGSKTGVLRGTVGTLI